MRFPPLQTAPKWRAEAGIARRKRANNPSLISRLEAKRIAGIARVFANMANRQRRSRHYVRTHKESETLRRAPGEFSLARSTNWHRSFGLRKGLQGSVVNDSQLPKARRLKIGACAVMKPGMDPKDSGPRIPRGY